MYLCVWVGWVSVWVCVCERFEVSVCVASDCVCPPGTAVQLSSSAAIQVFAFVFLHNRRRSSMRSVAVVLATAAAVSVDRTYIEEPSTPPSRGRRKLGRRRLLVLLDEVFPKPVAVDDQAENGCRWGWWRRQLQRWWWFHLCPATWSGRIVDRWRHWRAALAAPTVEVGRRWQIKVMFNSSRGPQLSSTVAATTAAMADSMDSGVVRSLIQARAYSRIPRKKNPSD